MSEFQYQCEEPYFKFQDVKILTFLGNRESEPTETTLIPMEFT